MKAEANIASRPVFLHNLEILESWRNPEVIERPGVYVERGSTQRPDASTDIICSYGVEILPVMRAGSLTIQASAARYLANVVLWHKPSENHFALLSSDQSITRDPEVKALYDGGIIIYSDVEADDLYTFPIPICNERIIALGDAHMGTLDSLEVIIKGGVPDLTEERVHRILQGYALQKICSHEGPDASEVTIIEEAAIRGEKPRQNLVELGAANLAKNGSYLSREERDMYRARMGARDIDRTGELSVVE